MSINTTLQHEVAQAIAALYGATFEAEKVNVAPTRQGVEGDYTVTVFPIAKIAKQAPPQVAASLGDYLVEKVPFVAEYRVINGFLNLFIKNNYWTDFIQTVLTTENYGFADANNEKVLVEFSSPNTNKPLHLGHIRNNLLGASVAKILTAAGYDVTTTQVINDRGVHICKSMLAWQRFGNGETPSSSGIKGDHLVGKYYVIFDKKLKEEYEAWQSSETAETLFLEWFEGENALKFRAEKGEDFDYKTHFFKTIYKNKYFNEQSALGEAVNKMLLAWEAGDSEVRQLWEMMNGWVYAGFEETYRNLGVHFDKNYYESNTYLFGKDKIEEGLQRGVFYQKDDSSVWIDLEDKKLDHKLVLRSNGTSVYITQDIGMAYSRAEDFAMKKMVYVVGDEQNYHFQVLFEILKKLEMPSAEGFYHLSYGMVDLPTGRMKSREGTVVDADDLMKEVVELCERESEMRGTLTELDENARHEIYQKIGMGALKYFMLRINPQRRMTFNPKESLDLQGQTGPYIQNAYVRTRSVQRKAADSVPQTPSETYALQPLEKELLIMLQEFPKTIQYAAANYDPSEIASYAYNLAKMYHRFYHDFPIFKNVESEAAKHFRLQVNEAVGKVLKISCALLGIEMPDYM